MTWLPTLLVTTVGASLGVLAALPWLRKRAVDVPNHRSSHTIPTPRGGGLGLLLGLTLGTIAAGVLDRSVPLPMIGVAAAMALLGLWDDLASQSAGRRIIIQGALGIAAGMVLLQSHQPLGWCTLIISVICVVGYTNAFNFMDGVNGISAVVGTITGAWYVWLGMSQQHDGLSSLGVLQLGMGLAFAPWNLFHARLFLGDVGSYLFGALGAVTALSAWTAGADPLLAAAPLIVYAVDTSAAVLGRLARGERITEAHRGHVYQRLADAGLSHPHVAGIVGLAVAAVCLFSNSFEEHPILGSLGVLGTVCCYLALPAALSLQQRESGHE